MSTTFLDVLLVVLPILLPPLVGAVVLFVKSQIARLPADLRVLVQAIVSTAVQAVEQTASNELNNAGKKELAMEKVKATLAHYKISVPDSEVSDLIEEFVSYLAPTHKVPPLPTFLENQKSIVVPVSPVMTGTTAVSI